ncbi:MAG: hypothetical protein QOE70_6379 [Chthoniobacter sp.]|nr:hypothetical protein [Chthoniobacter sp.]
MTLGEAVQAVPGFARWEHNDKIKFVAWHLHASEGRERFSQREIRLAYEELHLEQPSNIGVYLSALEKKKPKQLLRDGKGFYLPRVARDELDAKYGKRASAVVVDKLLQDLPSKIPISTERIFLDEALVCFRHGAFRAAIVMCWNLAFNHLEEFVVTKHLAAFNARIPIRYPKKGNLTIKSKDDFEELKESEVLEICNSAGIITGNVFKILSEKLTRRNLAAHPSTVVISPVQAEDFITDLVINVVLKLG